MQRHVVKPTAVIDWSTAVVAGVGDRRTAAGSGRASRRASRAATGGRGAPSVRILTGRRAQPARSDVANGPADVPQARRARRAREPRRSALEQQLGELDGVRRGALAQVVRDDPQVRQRSCDGSRRMRPTKTVVAARPRRSASGSGRRRGRRRRPRPGSGSSSSRRSLGLSGSRVCTLTDSEWR